MLGAHFVTLRLIFTPPACQAKRKVATQSDHDKPTHCCSLKMIPIWVSERKLAGAVLSSSSCSFAVCRRKEPPNGSQLRFGEALALAGPKTCSPIKASSAPGLLPRFPATWRDCAGEPTVITTQRTPRRQLSCLVVFAYI